ncbi:hypothetical protein [Moraxella lacunata]|uniref:hypothetical protein n=1 Tax=Moraxella lacunata TaxID=477 RepID=UPI003EE24198
MGKMMADGAGLKYLVQSLPQLSRLSGSVLIWLSSKCKSAKNWVKFMYFSAVFAKNSYHIKNLSHWG